MRDRVYNIKDIQQALEFATKKCLSTNVKITHDDLDRLILEVSSDNGTRYVIRVYSSDAATFPDVTYTEKLFNYNK
jgi:hypothetical protein